MRPIRTSVLGVGFSASVFQIPFILALPDLFTLHSILERRATADRSVARDAYGHTDVKVVTDYHVDILGDEQVDLVVVSIRSDAHYAYAKAALEAGKHVVLEKPVTATSAEMSELAELATSNNLVLAPYHNRRFDGDFKTIRRLLEAGKLGELIDFESRFDVYANWPMGPPGGSSGLSYGLGTHIVDQVVALFGKPSSVTAILANGRGVGHADVEDSFVVHLRYPNTKMLVTLRAVMHSVMSRQVRFVLRSLNKSYVKYGLDVQADQIMDKGMKPTDPGFGEESEAQWGELVHLTGGTDVHERVPTDTGSYLDYYRNVAAAIQGQAPLQVTAEDAILGLSIIEAARRSADEGKTVDL